MTSAGLMFVGNKEKRDERRAREYLFGQGEVKLNLSLLSVTAGSHMSKVIVSETVLSLDFIVDIMSVRPRHFSSLEHTRMTWRGR